MSKWLLIMIIYGNSSSPPPTTVLHEFKTMQTCEVVRGFYKGMLDDKHHKQQSMCLEIE